MAFATLSGIPVVRARLTVPYSGIWHVDVLLDRSIPPVTPGPQVLLLGASSWTCSYVRSIDFAGARGARLVGGLGGWRKVAAPRQYAAGVSTVMVLSDLSLQVGEPPPVLGPTVPLTPGTAWIRQGGVASVVLRQILGDAWYLDAAGIVQASPRLPTPIAVPFVVDEVAGAEGLYIVETEALSAWAPGAKFVGPTVIGTVNRVTHVLESSSLRSEVLIA